MNHDLATLYAQHTERFAPKRPLIAITGNFGEKGCELAAGYYESVLAAGGTPLVLPPSADLAALEPLLDRIDGLLLSGGADLNPLWMGEEPIPQLGGINPVRDGQELLLVRLAAEFRCSASVAVCR